ncbi:MAG: DUF6512 family protein [Candidatus Thorarchaeota archaeon]
MKNKVLVWEILGAAFIIILGSLFHFVFEWTGYWEPIGGFFPVNESVWEHLKLPYWPLVIFSLIEYRIVSDESKNFIMSKAAASILSITTIIVVFYSYTALLRIELLIVDILSFIFGVVLGQYVSYKILTAKKFDNWIIIFSWIIIIAFGTIFVLFTYFPPQIPIFQDPESGLYGMVMH